VETLTQLVLECFKSATQGKRASVPAVEDCEYVAAILILIRDHKKGKPAQEAREMEKRWRSLRRSFRPFENSPRVDAIVTRLERDMRFLLLFVGARPLIDEPIQTIASAAREAWARTQRPPKSLEPDGPICRFVSSALAHMGIHDSPETVSAVLRGRRRRNK
jgi:hypothetical protein